MIHYIKIKKGEEREVNTLNDLIKVGALQSNLKEVSLSNYPNSVITYSEFKAMSDTDRAIFKGIVTVDDSKWCATLKGVKPNRARKVFSGDGGLKCGSWDKEKREFFLGQIIDGKKCTIDKVKSSILPSEVNKTVTDNSGTLESENLSETRKEKENNMEKANGMDLLDAFNTETLNELKAEANTVINESVEDKKPDRKSEEINKIKAKVSDHQLADRTVLVNENQKNGRFIGFVTKSDATVKVAKAQVVKIQAGKKLLKPDAPVEIKEKHDKGESVAAKYYVKRSALKFRHANPGAVVGVVIATPANGEINLIELQDPSAKLSFDKANTTLKYKYHPIEEAYIILSAWYGGNIKEDDTLLGAKASFLKEEFYPVISKDADMSATPKFKAKLKHNAEIRSSMLCPENYFPLKIYDTVKYQNLSEEDALVLNYHLEAMLKNDTNNELLTELTEDDPDKIVKTPEGVTSKLFAPGVSAGPATTGEIKAFYSKEEVVKDVMIAKRNKKESKSKPGTYTYPFVYKTIDDVDGPLSVPQYRRVFDSFHIPEEEFKKLTSRAGKSSRTRKNRPTITSEDFLKASIIGGIVQGSSTQLSEVQAHLDGNIFE